MNVPEIVRDNHGHALIVFKVGRKMLHALALNASPVRIVKMEKAERRYLTPLLYKSAAYPLKRALRHFKQAGRDFGITKHARIIINALKGS